MLGYTMVKAAELQLLQREARRTEDIREQLAVRAREERPA
jgi:hypothetical protein